MITRQIPLKTMRYGWIYYLSATLIIPIISISCSRVLSFHHMISCSQTDLDNEEKNRDTEALKQKPYKIDARVKRWRTATIDQIKNFLDQGVAKYAHLTDEELWLQRTFHYLPRVAKLLHEKDYDDYFTIQEKDKIKSAEANARLELLPKEKDKPRKIYHAGKIEVGMHKANPSIIYHMMFRPKENTPALEATYPKALFNRNNETKGEHCKRKVTISYPNSYLKKKENSYIIRYAPPSISPYKLITIIIHKKNSQSL